MRNSLIFAFALRVLFWLFLCLIGWYFLRAALTAPVGWLSGSLLHSIFPSWVDGYEIHGSRIDLFTNIQVPSPRAGRVALLTPEADYLTFGYGLPLMVALFMASGIGRSLLKIPLAAVLLLPFTVFGVTFSWLKDVAIVAGPVAASQVHFGEIGRDVIALAYQFGVLILPTLAPIVIWLALDRATVLNMVRQECKDKQPVEKIN